MMTEAEANMAGVEVVKETVAMIASVCGERWNAPLSPARRIIYGQLAVSLLLKLGGNDVDVARQLFLDMIRRVQYKRV